ncbi:MAG: GNAT family N-acetyltransferase, partial [Nocardioidaceae bacterium]
FDESYGRILSVTGPGGMVICVDERSQDLYAYRLHKAEPDRRWSVRPIVAADAAEWRPFLTHLGPQPVTFDPQAGGVHLALGTTEAIADVGDRLTAAGFAVEPTEGGLAVTDPDGQIVRITRVGIRRATVADVDAVREIGLRTWPVAYAGLASAEFIEQGLAEWWSPEAVERGIRDGITLVAVEGPDLVGMVGLGQEDGFWVMWKLYVLHEQQGRGVGQDLLNAAIEALPERTDRLLLDVLKVNEAAIRFYRRNGFGPADRTPSRDLGPDLIWMSLDL